MFEQWIIELLLIPDVDTMMFWRRLTEVQFLGTEILRYYNNELLKLEWNAMEIQIYSGNGLVNVTDDPDGNMKIFQL